MFMGMKEKVETGLHLSFPFLMMYKRGEEKWKTGLLY